MSSCWPYAGTPSSIVASTADCQTTGADWHRKGKRVYALLDADEHRHATDAAFNSATGSMGACLLRGYAVGHWWSPVSMAGRRSQSPRSNRSWRAHGAISLGVVSVCMIWCKRNLADNPRVITDVEAAFLEIAEVSPAWQWLCDVSAVQGWREPPDCLKPSQPSITSGTAQRVGTSRWHDFFIKSSCWSPVYTRRLCRFDMQRSLPIFQDHEWSSFHRGFALILRPQARWRLCPLGRGHVARADAAVWCVHPLFSLWTHGHTLSVRGPWCRWEFYSIVAACNTRAIRRHP